MRWRYLIGSVALVVFGMSAPLALSTARPDSLSLPTPTVDTTLQPSPFSTSPVTTGTPAKSTAKKLATPRGNPIRVRITRQGHLVLNEPISGPIGLKRDNKGNLVYSNDRTVLEPPPTTVGWYHEQKAWPKPGFPGPSVLVAHISRKGNPGPFWNLDLVATGDLVAVAYDSGTTVTFLVTQNPVHLLKLKLPTDKIWNGTNRPVLRLITCDPATPFRAGHYAGNIIVYADRLVSQDD